jgi:hypothetical protein
MSIIINGCVCDSDVEVLEAIRRMVHRLTPDRRDPERFHEDKSEISSALTRLIKIAARHPSSLNARPQTPVQPANGQALLKAEALFRPPVAAAPRPRVYPRTPYLRSQPAVSALRLKTASWKTAWSAWRPRRHRYPRPPRNPNQRELL